MPGNKPAIGRFLDRVRDPLGGDGCAGFTSRLDCCGNQCRTGAWPGAVLNGNELRRGRKILETIPNRVLAFAPTVDETDWLGKFKLFSQIAEGVLHTLADDQHDFIDARSRIKSLPRVGDDRTAGDFEEKLVDIWTHARAFAGGDNDGGGHARKSLRCACESPKPKLKCRWSYERGLICDVASVQKHAGNGRIQQSRREADEQCAQTEAGEIVPAIGCDGADAAQLNADGGEIRKTG